MRLLFLLFTFACVACAQSRDGSLGTPPPKAVDASTSIPDAGNTNTVDASFGAEDISLGISSDLSEGNTPSLDGIDGSFDAGGNQVGGGTDGPCAFNGTPKAELGAPGLYFEAWKDGDSIPLTFGSEGGVSVSFNLALWGGYENAETLDVKVYQGSELIAEWLSNNVPLTCQAEGFLLLVQYAINLSPEIDVFTLIDQEGRVEVTANFGSFELSAAHSGTFQLEL